MNFDRTIVEENALVRAEDPAIRALVEIMGVLNKLPSERSKRRVLTHIADYFEELEDTPITL